VQGTGASVLVVRTEAACVEEGGSPPGRKSVAEKLEHLFHTVHGPRGREYTLEEVVEGIRASGGPTISVSYLWQLRKGVKDNPTKKHMEALADFFGVPAAYFFDDAVAERTEAELAMLTALRDAGVRRVALRAVGLSPRSLTAIQAIIESARSVEGLPDSAVKHEPSVEDDGGTDGGEAGGGP
jgi:transcriptional regulator with XRE-family HTH domain